MRDLEKFFLLDDWGSVLPLFPWIGTPQGWDYWEDVWMGRRPITQEVKELAYANLSGRRKKVVDTFWSPIALTDEEIWE